jgi:hypothetical protein
LKIETVQILIFNQIFDFFGIQPQPGALIQGHVHCELVGNIADPLSHQIFIAVVAVTGAVTDGSRTHHGFNGADQADNQAQKSPLIVVIVRCFSTGFLSTGL